jgi:hypothetical protein
MSERGDDSTPVPGPRRGPGRRWPPGPRKIRRTFRLDPEVDALLSRLAEIRDSDRTAALEQAIRTAAARAGVR